MTLKSPSIANALNSFWNFQSSNPQKTVRFRYLTTSEIGKEASLSFPDGLSGLKYWRVAARDGSDVEPIRLALLSMALSDDLREFVEKSSPELLRQRLLRQVHWDCGAEDISTLDRSIRDRLINFAEQRHYAPSDSERAHDALIAKLFRTIVEEDDRTLNSPCEIQSSMICRSPSDKRELNSGMRWPAGGSSSATLRNSKLPWGSPGTMTSN